MREPLLTALASLSCQPQSTGIRSHCSCQDGSLVMDKRKDWKTFSLGSWNKVGWLVGGWLVGFKSLKNGKEEQRTVGLIEVEFKPERSA